MDIINPEALLDLPQNNKFLGTQPVMSNSIIQFNGSNNILFCEKGVRLSNCSISFFGNDSVVFLSESWAEYKLNVSVWHKSVFFSGRHNYFNNTLNAILSERKHIFIGNECLFSLGVFMRLADPHLIYDVSSKQRINPSQSIFIGDHVWVGQEAKILKGTHIHSGSIVGAGSVVAGKIIDSNTSWGGNPAQELRKNIFWTGECVHGWTEEQSQKSQTREDDIYIYRNNTEEYLPFEELDRHLTKAANADLRYEYLYTLIKDTTKNRFAL